MDINAWISTLQEIEYYSFSKDGWIRHSISCYLADLPMAITTLHPSGTKFNRRITILGPAPKQLTLNGKSFISTLDTFNK